MRQLPTYQGFSAIYDALMDEAPYAEWLQFLQNALQKYPLSSNHVLDVGCGTARLACMLAQKGYSMTGVDLSSEMLAIAAERIRNTKLAPFALIQQDMRELDLGDTYALIYSFCDSLNYLLEMDDVIQTFHRVEKHLEADGLFIFDMHAPYRITHSYALGPIVDESEALAYIWIPEVDLDTLRVDHHIHFFVQQEGDHYRRFTELHQQRAYTIEQIRQCLDTANLEVLSISADFTDAEPVDTSERLFFVTRKKRKK